MYHGTASSHVTRTIGRPKVCPWLTLKNDMLKLKCPNRTGNQLQIRAIINWPSWYSRNRQVQHLWINLLSSTISLYSLAMHLYASPLALRKQQNIIHKNPGLSLMLLGDLCWFLKPPPHQRTNLASPLPRGFLGPFVWRRDGSKTSSFLAHCHQRMDHMKAVLVCTLGCKNEIDVARLYSYSWFLSFTHEILTYPLALILWTPTQCLHKRMLWHISSKLPSSFQVMGFWRPGLLNPQLHQG